MNESIRLKLSFSLLLAILAIAIVAGIFSFVTAFEEAHELRDNTLRQIAALFDNQRLSLAPVVEDLHVNGADEESRAIVQYLAVRGNVDRRRDSGMPLAIPKPLADGLHTLDGGRGAFRVLVKTTASGERIAVAQETGVRDEIARDSALRTLPPFLILSPGLLLIVADLVRKMFRPIADLAKEIDRRADQELHPVRETDLPIEVRPFAVAINRLLSRVGQSMQIQHRFIANAAHELRSPLAAISLQAERPASADLSALANERLVVLRRGIDRGRNLLDQLLSLARAQAAPDRPKSSVSVLHAYRRVLEDLLPLAEAKRIDIGVDGDEDARIQIHELDLVTVINNLVDNAIRYTPNGGRIDLSVTTKDGRALLKIADTGPGIEVAERDQNIRSVLSNAWQRACRFASGFVDSQGAHRWNRRRDRTWLL